VIEAQGRAKAIETINDALRQNPNYIRYLYVDKAVGQDQRHRLGPEHDHGSQGDPGEQAEMTIIPRSPALLMAVALAAGMLACSKETPPSGSAAGTATTIPDKPSLVLITMEATRADHLGCYENPQAQTPALDRLASEGARFTKAIAVAPLTLPSTASMLTGLYPPKHRLRGSTGYFFANTTFAEHLKRQGYTTAASVGARILAGELGFGRGFDTYAESRSAPRSAAAVIDDAIQAIDRLKERPFFLWIQLDDPRAPYRPPSDYGTRFPNRPYDGEIAWTDAQLQRFFEHLNTSGLRDRTLVVATADHGESLGEHGEDTHGLLLYDSTLKVPLIMRYPPVIPAKTKFDGLVSGVDLAPTLLALMGLPALPAAQGESCAARLLGQSLPEREAVYSESMLGAEIYGWVPLHALRSPDEKFIDAPEPELYNMKRDPSEIINLAATDRAMVASVWRPSMDEAFQAIGVVSPETTAGRIPAKKKRNLNGLVAAHNLYVSAEQALEEGRSDLAQPLLQQALAKDPGNPAVVAVLGALRSGLSPSASAAAGTFSGQLDLGNALEAKGNLPEAAKAFRAALAMQPNSAEAHYALGNVLAQQKDAIGAAAQLRAAVTADPKMVEGWNKLGIVLDKSNRRPEALAAFTNALEASPDHADALFNRAKIELLENQVTEARRDLDRLLTAHADYPAAKFLEAHICIAEKNTAGAKEALSDFLALPNTDARMKAAAQTCSRLWADDPEKLRARQLEADDAGLRPLADQAKPALAEDADRRRELGKSFRDDAPHLRHGERPGHEPSGRLGGIASAPLVAHDARSPPRRYRRLKADPCSRRFRSECRRRRGPRAR
jgi:arylsulfatase A-like enzyme/Tfp pilus assembly protein PilF